MTGPRGRTGGLIVRPIRWPFLSTSTAAIILWGAGASLAIGVAAGNPTTESAFRGIFFCVATILAIAVKRPYEAFLGIAASLIMLVVFSVTPQIGVNLFDLLVPPVLLSALLGTARRDARAADALETGAQHEAIRRAQGRLTRAAVLYFSLAAVSIVPMFFDGRAADGTFSLFCLVRAGEGLVLFPLGMWYLRGERRIRQAMTAMCVAPFALLAVNVPVKLLTDVKRAGMTFFVTLPKVPVADPNEGAAAMLIVVALVILLRAAQPHWSQMLFAGAALVMLVMTYSRSGLLAFLTFGALVLPRARLKPVLVVGAVLVLALPFVPQEYWRRLMHTLLMQKGTWDNYSSMIRLLSWATATNVFLHHPLFGVGYLGLKSVSTAYNDMRVQIGAESYLLEIAADLGVVGLIAFGFVIARAVQLGRAIQRVTPEGTLGHRMASLNAPMLIAILVANLTGSNLIGMVGIGQIALWCVMLSRAGHEALRRETPVAAFVPRGLPE